MHYQSKSRRLAEELLGDLKSRRFGMTDDLPPECRLAEVYQVSRNTVRRVLEQFVDNSLLIRRSNRRLGIRHDLVQSTPSIANRDDRRWVFGWIYAAYPDQLICNVERGIRDYAGENGLEMQCFFSSTDFEPALNAIRSAHTLGLNGLILLPSLNPEYREAVDHAIKRGIPVVSIGHFPGANCSSVGGDEFGSIFPLTRRLTEKYDRPAYFFGPTAEAANRYMAYCRAMNDCGYGELIEQYTWDIPAYSAQPESWSPEDKVRRPAMLAHEFLSSIKSFPATVICLNDYMACGIYRAAAGLNLRIGRDLKVTGFGDLPMVKKLNPALSTFHTDTRLLGFQAAWILHRQLDRQLNAPVHQLLPTEFIERESTK